VSARVAADIALTLDHPRATWLDGETLRMVDQRAVLARACARRVVLLGETHDIAEIHRWQLHVACALHALRPGLAMGFEMFPRRVQPALDAWVAGQCDTGTFLDSVEWGVSWGFDPDLYLPLFHFCRQQRIPMRALNCHRTLVSRVGKEGWETIPEGERDGLTPAASATPAYRAYLNALIGAEPGREGEDRFVRAQQTWDRAFACGIADYLMTAGEEAFIVCCIGRGHLEYGHGVAFQLRDLGVDDVVTLLPSEESRPRETVRGMCDALYRLDTPDPRPERPMPPTRR
jgi:uncharacterized iron-regulated protein